MIIISEIIISEIKNHYLLRMRVASYTVWLRCGQPPAFYGMGAKSGFTCLHSYI